MYVECAIKGPNLTTIQWFFSPSNGSGTIELQNDSKYTINNVTSDAADFSSQLTVQGFVDNSDAGVYWCMGVLDDGSTLQTLSSELLVEEEESYENLLFTCIEGTFLKNSVAKCVSVVTDSRENSSTFSAMELSTMKALTEAGNRISPTVFIIVVVVTLFVVAVLFIMCTILTTIVSLQCRRRLKMRNEHRGKLPAQHVTDYIR